MAITIFYCSFTDKFLEKQGLIWYNVYIIRRVERFIDIAKEQGRMGVVLTCKDRLIHYYEKFGFVNDGLTAKTTHGGAESYQMRLYLLQE